MFLFGFVQVFYTVVKVTVNKVVAVLLDTERMRVIGILRTAMRLIQVGAGLSIFQSAVRNVSEVYKKEHIVCNKNSIIKQNSVAFAN